jgi:hypothetical protein
VSADELLGREVEARLGEWLAAVARVPPEAFTPVERFDDMSGTARADSWFWCDSIFREEVNPHNEAIGCRHAFHLATDDTPDLLRHEYSAGGLDLVVTESRNFVLVQVARSCVDVLALCGPDRAAAIRRLSAAIFAAGGGAAPAVPVTAAGGAAFRGPLGDACVPLELPPVIEEGTAFSSNPEADPAVLACWKDRTECGVQGGCLYFLCYKKSSQRAGYENARQWFDEAFRCRAR